MRTIPLNHGLVAIVDDEDYEWLSNYNWRCTNTPWSTRKTYVYRHWLMEPGRNAQIFLHREVIATIPGVRVLPGFMVDHINGDRLDNRKQNLRVATNGQNQMNSPPKMGRRYKGVYLYKRSWFAQICGKRIGSFPSEEAAAAAYNVAALARFGPFAKLNIIPPHTCPSSS